MPEQMFMYRSASFWLAVHYPEGLAGLPTREEIEDAEAANRAIDVTPPPGSDPSRPRYVAAQATVVPAEPEDRTLEPGVDPKSMQGKPVPGFTSIPADGSKRTPFDKPGDPPVEKAPPKRRGPAAVKEAMAKNEAGPPATPPAATPELPESLQKVHEQAKAQAAGPQPTQERIDQAAKELAQKVAAQEKVQPKANPTNAEMVEWCKANPEAKIPDMLKVFQTGYVSASTAWNQAREQEKK
jgi:hypothetical protein